MNIDIEIALLLWIPRLTVVTCFLVSFKLLQALTRQQKELHAAITSMDKTIKTLSYIAKGIVLQNSLKKEQELKNVNKKDNTDS